MPRFPQFRRQPVEQKKAMATLSSFARPFEPPGEIERPTVLQFRPKDSIMRIASVLTLIAATAVSFTASAAPANSNVEAGVNTVPVSAHGSYKVQPSELAGVQGAYALEDGRTLRVTAHRHHLYAELGATRTELIPVAPNKFASNDDSVRVAFNGSDEPTEVKVSTIAQ
jgi:hypothetical protein